jgi:transcriptional regulator with XRE-family HTH domain
MESRGLVKKRWAEAARINPNLLYNYLRDEPFTKDLSISTYARLASAAGATINELIGEPLPANVGSTIDEALLEDTIEAIDAAWQAPGPGQKKRPPLDARRKAKLTAYLYRLFLARGRVETGELSRVLGLIE